MRNLLFLILLSLLTISCDKEVNISEELIGDWFYEREVFDSQSSFSFEDKSGIMSFRNDMTGNWDNPNEFIILDIEWELRSNNSQIWLKKQGENQFPFANNDKVFDLERIDENKYTLTYQESNPLEYFENIILTRI